MQPIASSAEAFGKLLGLPVVDDPEPEPDAPASGPTCPLCHHQISADLSAAIAALIAATVSGGRPGRPASGSQTDDG